jgi:hypothetical protein
MSGHQGVTAIEGRTLDAPILFRIAEEQDELNSSKSLEIIDRKNFGESFFECLHLSLDTFPKDRIENIMDVVIYVARGDGNIFATVLQSKGLRQKMRK